MFNSIPMNDKLLKELYPERRHLRLCSYAYTWQGAYFVTICTKDKHCLFGKIVDSTVKLNPLGEVVESVWKEMPLHYPDVNNEVFIVMPESCPRNNRYSQGWTGGFETRPYERVPFIRVVRAFKTYSSRRINELRNSRGIPVWQRNYYEHVIRNESDYRQIGEYILYNPAKWETDPDNPNTKLKSPPSSFEH